MRPRLALAALLALAPLPALSAPDEPVLAAARTEDGPFGETLKALVDVDTGTGDVPGLAAVEGRLKQRLEKLGFSVETRPAPAFGGGIR